MLQPGHASACHIPATLDMDSHIRDTSDGKVIGRLQEPCATVFKALLDEESLEFQFICSMQGVELEAKRAKKGKLIPSVTVSLSAVIYGPMKRSDDIGSYLDSCELYLQDPQHCDRNVKYHNPHRLSSLDTHAPMTMDVVLRQRQRREIAERPVNFLNELECNARFPKSPQPPSVTTLLHR